jgi:hypothetical protein
MARLAAGPFAFPDDRRFATSIRIRCRKKMGVPLPLPIDSGKKS